ncbi:MAG: hypothetical protein KA257_01235 [Opitutaceae bacterium]|nr:hypothetical protein [Opitutaceae bacterium]MBP9912828.1 hypothetical protein [Opitutaceae bacterium]
MKSAEPEPADLVPRLRQQLILAQVRVMELEDVRENLTPQLAELENLLRAAQLLADQKTDEATHLTKVLGETQSHAAQLGQLQVKLAQDLAAAITQLEQRETSIQQLDAASRQLEAELQAMKSSRSWRWTAWLRRLGGK